MHSRWPKLQPDEARTAKLKTNFADWLQKNYRIRKPDPETEVYVDGKESTELRAAYEKKIPLLADSYPELLPVLRKHYDTFIDLYDQYYTAPRRRDRPSMNEGCSDIMTSLYYTLLDNYEKNPDPAKNIDPKYGFDPGDLWRNVYVQSCRNYYAATGQNPMLDKTAVGVKFRVEPEPGAER